MSNCRWLKINKYFRSNILKKSLSLFNRPESSFPRHLPPQLPPSLTTLLSLSQLSSVTPKEPRQWHTDSTEFKWSHHCKLFPVLESGDRILLSHSQSCKASKSYRRCGQEHESWLFTAVLVWWITMCLSCSGHTPMSDSNVCGKRTDFTWVTLTQGIPWM